jgi:hypothetical protein
VIIAFAVGAAWPSAAGAHGPIAPIATSYLAKVSGAPAGLKAKVIDGDQRMWLRADDHRGVVVLDYRGAPYLRFSRAGVEVNQHSAMYYLNLTPAEVPPSNLSRTAPPKWVRATTGHAYGWHDGRLHALAGAARLPGDAFVGNWSIPVIVDGQLRSIHGGLYHAPNPSIAWFWPIVVLLACVLAARRVRSAALDDAVARALAAAALVAITAGSIGRQLHGRPGVSAWQLFVFGLVVAFVMWAAVRVLARRRHGSFYFFAIAVVAIWVGIELLPVLLHGFVLAAVPAFIARTATVLCLGCGAALLLVAFRLGDRAVDESPSAEVAAMAGSILAAALVLTGCGSAHHAASDAGIPANLVAESRPIGRGPSFHPGVTGPVIGPCRARLGLRSGVHVELFAADRVVIVPSGIGTEPPRQFDAGRISKARCYGDLVTLEPTGVVQVRPRSRLYLSDLFRSWGQPLSRRRLASFSTRRQVEVFVNGRRWLGSPGRVPLIAHAEIVLEVGPQVPPHRSYTFPPGT